jgi:hypothetical protein
MWGAAMFSSEVVLRNGNRRRAAPRSSTACDTLFDRALEATRSPCRIIDISAGGARLRLYVDIEPETKIRLSLPGRGQVDAHIVWANGSEAGCCFDTPLDEMAVTAIMASART